MAQLEAATALYVRAISATVAITISATVAFTVAAAIAAAVAGAVGGAVVGGGGGGVGGVFPLLMGAQRLDLTTGLVVPKSDIQTGVADGLGWTGGDWGLITDPPTDQTGRRLQGVETRPKALTALYSKLTSIGIAMGICVLLQTLVHLHWKHRGNRAYYARRKLVRDVHAAEGLAKAGTDSVAYKKYPIVFVFPSVFLIVFKLFVTGLTNESVTLLVTAECNVACKGLASVTLAWGLAYVGWGWFVLTDFNLQWARDQWKPAEKPLAVHKVDDPLYRGISVLRAKLFRFQPDDPRAILDRPQGKFGKVAAQAKEPERTERQLAKPLQLRKTNATDFLEAYQFPYMPLAGGTSRVSVYFNHLIMTCQLVMSVLSGLGKAGVLDEAAGRVQVQRAPTPNSSQPVPSATPQLSSDRSPVTWVPWRCLASVRSNFSTVSKAACSSTSGASSQPTTESTI